MKLNIRKMPYSKLKLHIKAIFQTIIHPLKHEPGQQTENDTHKNPIFITLTEAKKDPELVSEMRRQIKEAVIVKGSEKDYVSDFIVNGQQYYVSAAQKEWKSFYGTQVYNPGISQESNKF